MTRHILLAVPFLFAAPASAASLRSATALRAPVVVLADLFDDAGPRAGRVLGPAPAPGERIVVEAPQLAAIARQFGVDWRPAGPADRAVLERPGKLLPRAAVIAAVRDALPAAGAPADADLDLPGFEAPMIPAATVPDITVEQLDYDAGTARFTAALVVAGEGMAPLRLRISGRADAMVDGIVAARLLRPGTALAPGDVRVARIRATLLRDASPASPAAAAGMAPRHTIAAGQPVTMADLERPPAVTKGARVSLLVAAPGLEVQADGIAQEAGAVGDTVRVLNPVSRMVIEGTVVAPGRVDVAPGSVPIPADAARLAQSRLPQPQLAQR